VIHVFTGPTISVSDPALSGLKFRPRPPARHGDLFDPAITGGDTVVIIDGLFHHAPALRHKEILAVLARGVRVIGAASIGALRAAELSQFGVLGVGAVFHAYACGAIEGDDEVAVGQSAGSDLRACSWPLVSVREVLRLGTDAGVIDPSAVGAVLEELREVYYPHRSLTAVTTVSRTLGAEGFVTWLTVRLGEDPYFGDIKRRDALQALETALVLDGTPVPVPADLVWRTPSYQQWENAFAAQNADGAGLFTRDRVAYQQIFDPCFTDVWWNVLSRAGTGGLPRALACAVLRPDIRLADPDTVALVLAHETPADRRALARYLELNDKAGRSYPGFCPETVKDSVARELLAALWRTQPGALEEQSWARGFADAREATETVKRFVLGLRADQKGEGR
jgi:hypothetical protein